MVSRLRGGSYLNSMLSHAGDGWFRSLLDMPIHLLSIVQRSRNTSCWLQSFYCC